MCGLFAIHSFNRELLNDGLIEKTKRVIGKLSHRGPDGSGLIFKKSSILGHTRLSIIDIDNGQQPMISDDGNFCITYNGEIYNYNEIRHDLIQRGYKFKTASDTEVVLKAFIEFGVDCLKKFHGMFAFVIVNFDTKECFAAGDRYGIKPLYVSTINDLYIFSSEIRPLFELGLVPNELDSTKIEEFLVFGYIAGEKTLYKNFKQIEPGHYFHITNDKSDYRRYWHPGSKERNISFQDAIEELDFKLRKAVKLWSIADVEVGALLSGGVDSTTITSLLNKDVTSLQTFSLLFSNDKDIDESHHIKNMITEINVKSNFINFDDSYFVNNLFKLSDHFDEPILDPNNYSLNAICEKIKNISDIKVVLCGEGADEIFGGYARHRQIADEYQKYHDENILLMALNRVALPRLEILGANKNFSRENRKIIIKSLVSKDPVNKVLEYDQLTFLNTRLHSQDRIGMLNSLEIRTPFLEHDLTEFVNSLPGKYKINDEWSKFILRTVAQKYIPKTIVWEKKKIGLSIPYSRMLFKGELRDIFIDLVINNGKINQYFSSKNITNLLNLHNPNNGNDHSNTLFRLLSLELFLRSI